MRRENNEVTVDGVNNIDDVNRIDDVNNTESMLPSSDNDMEDYDPHKHRNRPNPTS